MGTNKSTDVCRHIGTDPTRRYLKSKEASVGEQLLPGVPDEITWDIILPKLSWRDSQALSPVSRAWEEAIRTNYEGRVRANSTETLIIHVHVYDCTDTIALFSRRENLCCELPGIPWLPRGVPRFSECIAVGRKIYLLGGQEVMGGRRVVGGGLVVRDPISIASAKVYVLDLARRQWKWELCASMLQPRYHFGCGFIDDKIYVFGGRNEVFSEDLEWRFRTEWPFRTLLRCEVYDTQKNSWSPIMPMGQIIDFDVPIIAPVGKELFLYHNHAKTLGVYNSAKNEWSFSKLVWGRNSLSLLFVTEGTIYSFSDSGIDVYDAERNSWINRHTHSVDARLPLDRFNPVSILVVKDKLFLTRNFSNCHYQSLYCEGFNTEKKKLVWKITGCRFGGTQGRVLQVPIQL